MISTDVFKINKVKESRLKEVDFQNLPFGRIFSDHMFSMKFENGAWQTPEIKPFSKLSMSPATSVLHYGQSIFEGLKAYKGKDGNIRLFRPEVNASRFNKSAERMCMPSVPEDTFVEGIKQLVNLDQGWVPDGEGSSLYIRLFMFASDDFIGVRPSDTYEFIIFTGPVSSYYSEPVKVKLEKSFTRAAQGGVGYAKTAGNYAASLYPAKKAQEEGYHQLLWTDGVTHEYIEESGTMNVMFRIRDTLVTPASSSSILESVTRVSTVEIAKKWGYKVEERKVTVKEIQEALEKGTLEEAFGLGTAATVAHIASIHIEGTDYTLPGIEERTFANKVLNYFDDLKAGVITDEMNWIQMV